MVGLGDGLDTRILPEIAPTPELTLSAQNWPELSHMTQYDMRRTIQLPRAFRNGILIPRMLRSKAVLCLPSLLSCRRIRLKTFTVRETVSSLDMVEAPRIHGEEFIELYEGELDTPGDNRTPREGETRYNTIRPHR